MAEDMVIPLEAGERVEILVGEREVTVRRHQEQQQESHHVVTDGLIPKQQIQAAPIQPASVVKLWREVCVPAGLPDIKALSKNRRTKIAQRARSVLPTMEEWARYFHVLAGNPFMRGDNDRGWKATIDYAIRSDDVVLGNLEKADAAQAPSNGGIQSLDGWEE